MHNKKKRKKVNPGHFHEIADRCHMVNCTIDDHIIGHPGMTEEMTTAAKKVQDLLSYIMNAAWSEQERLFPDAYK